MRSRDEMVKPEILVSFSQQQSPTFLAPGTGFVEDHFSRDQAIGDGFRMIQMNYIYCALYLYYSFIRSSSIRSQSLETPDLADSAVFPCGGCYESTL